MELNIKFTKNIDYFIVYLLPYLEIYLREHLRSLILHANEQVCQIVMQMFGKLISTRKTNSFLSNSQIVELDKFLSDFYDITQILPLSRPLLPSDHLKLKNRDYVCIYPKFKPTEPYNNITHEMLDELLMKTNLHNCEIFIIGNPFDRLNTKIGKDVNSFIDTLNYLKYCKLFITSESNWHYIALLCNCRNTIIYSTQSHNSIEYNPFNNNISATNELNQKPIYDEINRILLKK